MDKKIAGLLGAVAALSTANAAQASAPVQTDVLRANSYADLLAPVPNAVAMLKVLDEQGPVSTPKAGMQLAAHHHHHHHHHHGYSRRTLIVVGRHRHHHHHHHHDHHHHHRY